MNFNDVEWESLNFRAKVRFESHLCHFHVIRHFPEPLFPHLYHDDPKNNLITGLLVIKQNNT